jgi:hypothetical protein
MRERNGGLLEEDHENENEDDPMDESKLGPPFGIVINGHSLVSKSYNNFMFLHTATY